MSGYGDLQATAGQLRYKPGWSFRLSSGASFSSSCVRQEISGPFSPALVSAGYAVLMPPVHLVICVITEDSGGAGEISVEHRFAVPETEANWRRWLLDRILDVERHEACEFFEVAGERPFYPAHGPDADLYAIAEREPAAA